MKRVFNLYVLLAVGLAFMSFACGRTNANENEKAEGVEWNVTVRPAIQFVDSLSGVSTEEYYTVADTARINKKINELQPENFTLGWSLPNAEGAIWLIAYEDHPLISEKVEVNDITYIPNNEGEVQALFKFTDENKWATVTKDNIANKLAIFVDGELINAPQITSEITSGNCSVLIPADKIHDFIPDLDLDKLKNKQ